MRARSVSNRKPMAKTARRTSSSSWSPVGCMLYRWSGRVALNHWARMPRRTLRTRAPISMCCIPDSRSTSNSPLMRWRSRPPPRLVVAVDAAAIDGWRAPAMPPALSSEVGGTPGPPKVGDSGVDRTGAGLVSSRSRAGFGWKTASSIRLTAMRTAPTAGPVTVTTISRAAARSRHGHRLSKYSMTSCAGGSGTATTRNVLVRAWGKRTTGLSVTMATCSHPRDAQCAAHFWSTTSVSSSRSPTWSHTITGTRCGDDGPPSSSVPDPIERHAASARCFASIVSASAKEAATLRHASRSSRSSAFSSSSPVPPLSTSPRLPMAPAIARSTRVVT
mmetsp:Transcript_28823/g.89243  ORF Transcript_28823/g.89243 Transcript_28823/m.89243 type:complete len:333 (+) Transcript_28823:469-1467(+)